MNAFVAKWKNTQKGQVIIGNELEMKKNQYEGGKVVLWGKCAQTFCLELKPAKEGWEMPVVSLSLRRLGEMGVALYLLFAVNSVEGNFLIILLNCH